MLSTQRAKLVSKILMLILIAALTFFFLAAEIPETEFIKDSIESIEDSNDTVMRFSAATLSTSLAISALPDDFATPLAESLSDMNIYFVAILVVLFLEKILILYGVKLTLTIILPIACGIGILSVLLKSDIIKSFAIRLSILGLAVALVVPCSTQLTKVVAADLTAYVEETIVDTEDGAGKLNEAMDGSTEEQTMFERLSELFQTAMDGVSDLMLHFQNTIRKCMNSIAILILTNCLMPLLSFFILRWVLKETFQLAIPLPPMKRRHHAHSRTEEAETDLAVIGE